MFHRRCVPAVSSYPTEELKNLSIPTTQLVQRLSEVLGRPEYWRWWRKCAEQLGSAGVESAIGQFEENMQTPAGRKLRRDADKDFEGRGNANGLLNRMSGVALLPQHIVVARPQLAQGSRGGEEPCPRQRSLAAYPQLIKILPLCFQNFCPTVYDVSLNTPVAQYY